LLSNVDCLLLPVFYNSFFTCQTFHWPPGITIACHCDLFFMPASYGSGNVARQQQRQRRWQQQWTGNGDGDGEGYVRSDGYGDGIGDGDGDGNSVSNGICGADGDSNAPSSSFIIIASLSLLHLPSLRSSPPPSIII
jgi:hypothetical protein